MFKFLFRKKEIEAIKETQRETVERAVKELNEILEGMAEKARISVDLQSGLIDVDLPEQMPDEALALPAPEKAETATKSEETPDEEKPAAA